MNSRDDEAWLDTLLQRRLPSTPSDSGFQREVLQSLPSRERPVRRAFILILSWIAAFLVLLLPIGADAVVQSSSYTEAGLIAVSSCLGTGVLWYFVDRLR